MSQLILEFSSTFAWQSHVIRIMTNSPFSHVNILLPGEGLLGASDPGGVMVRPFDYEPMMIRQRAVIATPKADAIIARARSQVGKPFDDDALHAFWHQPTSANPTAYARLARAVAVVLRGARVLGDGGRRVLVLRDPDAGEPGDAAAAAGVRQPVHGRGRVAREQDRGSEAVKTHDAIFVDHENMKKDEEGYYIHGSCRIALDGFCVTHQTSNWAVCANEKMVEREMVKP